MTRLSKTRTRLMHLSQTLSDGRNISLTLEEVTDLMKDLANLGLYFKVTREVSTSVPLSTFTHFYSIEIVDSQEHINVCIKTL